MLRSLYISASGMLAQSRALDVLTNNLANMDTPGFKSDSLMLRSFNDVLIERINSPTGNANIGQMNWGVHPDTVSTDFTQGPLEFSGGMHDMALSGEGFFVVETPQGLRFTRSGNFQVNAGGFLCTQQGYFVRGTAGRIQVGSGDFSVDTAGNITSAGGNYKLQVVRFNDNAVLRKVGDNLLSGPATATAAGASVLQGFVEGSNVDLSREMTNMISVSRSYETNQRVMSMLNDTLEKTVNDVGRI